LDRVGLFDMSETQLCGQSNDDYDDETNDEILNSSDAAKSENAQRSESNQKISEAHFENILDEELAQMAKSFQLTLKCHQCEMKFYSNNKLHKHLRSDQHTTQHQRISESHRKQIANISIVISTREHKNHKNFVFREHQYARVKRTFEAKDKTHDFCANFETFMSLIDRKFLEMNITRINIMKTKFNLKIRDIDSKTHDTSSYCALDLYFQKHVNDRSKIAHIRDEFHLVDDLQVNVLIEMNIMSSKKCILNFKIKSLIFIACEDIMISITIVRTRQFVNRSVLIVDKIVISSRTDMIVLIKIREQSLSERDYIFNSKEKTLLKLEKEFFSHILINKSVAVQMRNTFSQSFVIFKNYRIEKLNDYHESECFVISSEDKNLIIALNRLSRQILNSRKISNIEKSFEKNKLKTVLHNEITVHDDTEIVKRIIDVIDKYLDV
jgi:hypothetical protein